jgi:hypothetical protein
VFAWAFSLRPGDVDGRRNVRRTSNTEALLPFKFDAKTNLKFEARMSRPELADEIAKEIPPFPFDLKRQAGLC